MGQKDPLVKPPTSQKSSGQVFAFICGCWNKYWDWKNICRPLYGTHWWLLQVLRLDFSSRRSFTGSFSFYKKRSDYYFFKSVTRYLQAPANILIPLLTLNAALPLLDIRDQSPFSRVIELASIGAFAFLLIRIIALLEDLIYQRNDISVADNLKARKIRTQIKFLSRMGIVIVFVLALSAMLLSFDNFRKVGTGLLAGVGVGSIIIGFAAQSTLSNLLAGFQIAFTQPIRIDDVVVVENEWGRIEDITLTYVVVRIWDDRRLVLPINYFITKPFQNWTRVNSDLLGSVFLQMDHTLPVDKLRKEFESLLHASPLWDRRVSVIQVTDCKERTIEIRALMSARNSSDAFDLRCHVREKLIAFVQEHYPHSLPKTRSEASIVPDREAEMNSKTEKQFNI